MAESLQQKAIQTLRDYGYNDWHEGGLVLLRQGVPIDQRWVPQTGTGFLRYDRFDGKWEAVLYKASPKPITPESPQEGFIEEWVFPDEYVVLHYTK